MRLSDRLRLMVRTAECCARHLVKREQHSEADGERTERDEGVADVALCLQLVCEQRVGNGGIAARQCVVYFLSRLELYQAEVHGELQRHEDGRLARHSEHIIAAE